MEPTDEADDTSRDEDGFQNSGLESPGGRKERKEVEDGEGSKKGQPEDAGGEDGTSGVRRPESRKCGVEWEKRKEKKAAVRDAREGAF